MERLGRLSFCDGLAAVAAVDLSKASYQVDLNADIIIDGPYAGSVMYNWPVYCGSFDEKKVNVRVLSDFKHQESVDLWLDSLRHP